MMGEIAKRASSGETETSTLRIELNHFVRLVLVIAVTMGIVCFTLDLVRNGTGEGV
jgi:magnesium-transporting ATPase (P-type)